MRFITLIDFARPMAARLASRKVCGPYRWTPSEPGKGRGFYTGRDLECAPHGAGFRLRLEDANDHISGPMGRVSGYFCDAGGDGDTLQPIIARLPRGRGFLAGWTMGAGMASAVDSTVYGDVRDAAYAAHAMADSDAEKSRDEAEQFDLEAA